MQRPLHVQDKKPMDIGRKGQYVDNLFFYCDLIDFSKKIFQCVSTILLDLDGVPLKCLKNPDHQNCEGPCMLYEPFGL